MTDIDFIKQKNKATSAKVGKTRYGVEYTNPDKSHRSLKEWFSGFSKKRKHTATAVPPVAPQQPGSRLNGTGLSSPNLTAQPQAKPEITPIPGARSVTTMPATNQPTVAPNTSGSLAPALAPLTRTSSSSLTSSSSSVTLPPSVPSPSSAVKSAAHPVAEIAPAITPIKPPSPVASTLAMPADKTMLLKVRPAVKQTNRSTVTALRVIPTPPPPPPPPPVHIAPLSRPQSQPQPAVLTPLPASLKTPPTVHVPSAPVSVTPHPSVTTQKSTETKVALDRVLPTPPAPPLHGLPVKAAVQGVPAMRHSTVSTKEKSGTASVSPALSAVVHAPTEASGDDIQAHIQTHNVSAYTGATTNPNRPVETALHINLLPQLSTALTPVIGKVQQVVNTILLGGIIIGVAYLAILGYQTYYFIRTNVNLTQVDSLENQILAYRSLQEQVNATADQLTTINTLLSEHRYWTNIFALLEHYTLPNVYYTLVNADANGTVTLQAATTDYASVSHQIEVFRRANRFIQQVDVSTATSGGSEQSTTTGIVTFNLTLQINPEVLHYHYDGYFKD